jgi:Tol biopolymer transport system component
LIGQTIAHYDITEKLGQGGMGEVYRARDTKLDREVALKLLPTELSGDPERAARFEREARMLASLQHPNIASIYGYEHVGNTRFLTMELVEGEDLARRLERGPASIEDTLEVALQMAVGLEAAHLRGIIHRDLKPANVKLDPSGKVKILDFGLARAYSGDALEPEDLATSPTITAAMTQAGVILGTAAYMSPEQAKGRPVDHRSDIWSYGVLLFEMLTGQKLFEGETVSETMAEVMKSGIDWDTLPPSTPPHLRALLQRCLDRDAQSRLQSIGEARIMLERGDHSSAPATSSVASGARKWPITLVSIALLTAVAALIWTNRGGEPPAQLVQSTLLPPQETYFAAESPFALSPDGRSVAFVASVILENAATPIGGRSIWVRDLSETRAREIEGTSGAQYPFWSADGRMLGFFANGKLNKVDLRGGPVIALCDTEDGRGGTWNEEGTIIFQRAWSEGLMRIHAAGGTPQPVTRLDHELFDVAHRWPSFLPGGRRFLFYVVNTTSFSGSELTGIYEGSLDSDETKMVLRGESRGLYSQGHLVYRIGSTLMADEFDLATSTVAGNPSPIASDIPGGGISWGGAHFGISANGTLVHLRGAGATDSRLVWRDFDGNEIGSVGKEGGYWEPALSHDGRYLAVSEGRDVGDIWIHDLDRASRTRFTFDPADDRSPIWSPDDQKIAFSSARQTVGEIYERPVSGQSEPRLLHNANTNITLHDWSSDGRWIIFTGLALGDGVWDILAFDTVEEKVVPIVEGPFSQQYPEVSPDGKWIAFASGESGRQQIYVQPFPSGQGRWMVSVDGGDHPRWTADGKALIYMGGLTEEFYRVEVSHESGPSFGAPVRLFAGPTKPGTGSVFVIARDGQSLLLNERLPMDRSNHGASLIQNWTRILER